MLGIFFAKNIPAQCFKIKILHSNVLKEKPEDRLCIIFEADKSRRKAAFAFN
jgi:hypothetical protein